jgi:hypothetical protein
LTSNQHAISSSAQVYTCPDHKLWIWRWSSATCKTITNPH